MKKHLTNYSFLILLFSLFTGMTLQAQTATLTSKILDGKSQAVEFATIALKSAIDSTLVKVEMTDENGIFTIQNITPADYLLEITYVGLADFRKIITVNQGSNDLGTLNM
ncbi:MAG TPA: carboxypeptidase-like regulatory domain-containing protein, partial [Saprospiraceae bacterium]|nr:carboxypeptidase-like regulatory domain-containing protein [Saprospiraceae bacterium]